METSSKLKKNNNNNIQREERKCKVSQILLKYTSVNGD